MDAKTVVLPDAKTVVLPDAKTVVLPDAKTVVLPDAKTGALREVARRNRRFLLKEKAIRKEAAQWSLPLEYLDPEQQPTCFADTSVCALAKRQIMNKIHGYKSQDIEKHKYNPDLFVDYDFVRNLLIEKNFKCYYCKEPVFVFYNYVRENKQWTLERIDNSMGHNKDNVQVACLICNLRRRTMHHERYLLTKQMMVVKKLD